MRRIQPDMYHHVSTHPLVAALPTCVLPICARRTPGTRLTRMAPNFSNPQQMLQCG